MSWRVSCLVVATFLIACSSSGSGGSGGTGSCADVCPSVVAAHCTQGPVSEADCESGCAAIQSGPCASQYNALLSCGGPKPAFMCDPSGNIAVTGCDAQNSALNNCLASH